jgi:hypothetical protein
MESTIKSTHKKQKLKGKSRKYQDNWRQYSPKGGNIVINGLKWKVPLTKNKS